MEEFRANPAYRILSPIAEGGMGAVYLAEQKGIAGFRKTVALKTILPSLLEDEETLDLFVGEAKLVADLIHENILQVYHLDEKDGQIYLVMEYVFGKSLDKLSERLRDMGELLPVDLAAFIISRVCRALDYAHRKKDRSGNPLGIVHRDITPSNIIVQFGGVVKLADFGIAKALTMNIPDEHDVIMGKYAYMAPEMARFQGTDPRSDLFGLGLVGYEILTGKRVYDAENSSELLDRMENYLIPPPRKLLPDIPESLSDIIMHALEMNPENRYQSAHEMGNALEHFLYDDGYGPTNEKLGDYMAELFAETLKEAYG
ncbi:MAG: serine/threonine-protein kinase [Planctomycetota bacterium]|nr:serine/threonine-protein kinase [Planctomycetota bacterium]